MAKKAPIAGIMLCVLAVIPGLASSHANEKGQFVPAIPFTNEPHTPVPYRIDSVQAFLFYAHSGKFSENLIDNKNFPLWNVIIGEGSALPSASQQTMVVVKLKGERGGYPGIKVHFVARSPTRTLCDTTSDTGVFSSGYRPGELELGVWYSAFWLDGTGCERLTLEVSIVGEPKEKTIRKTIDFECGE